MAGDPIQDYINNNTRSKTPSAKFQKIGDKVVGTINAARIVETVDRNTHQPQPAYVLSNLSGNIKRNRDRLEQVKRQTARTAAAETAGGVSVDALQGGYCSVTFAEKPARDVLDGLKAAGFHWRKGSWWGKRADLPEGIVS